MTFELNNHADCQFRLFNISKDWPDDRVRIFLLILLLLAYPLIAHVLIIYGIPNVAVIMLVSLGLFSIISGMFTGAGKKPDQLKILIYVVIVLWGFTNLVTSSFQVLFVPSVVINSVITLVVAASLRKGATPIMEMILRFSAVAELPGLVVREARILTMIWAVFFFVMAIISLALAIWTDLATWSLFANVLYFVILAVFILISHGYVHFRYRKLGVLISWQSAYKLMRMYSSLRKTKRKTDQVLTRGQNE